MDIMLAFPLLILALAIVTVLGRSIPNLILAIAIPVIPRTAVLCGLAPSPPRKMSTWKRPVPSAARIRVMFRHVAERHGAYLIVLTAQLGGAILTEASLSFLGLGTAEPTPPGG